MQKGQISFDLLLTGIVLISMLGSVNTFTEFLQASGENVTANAMQKQAISGITGVLASAKIISDGETGSMLSYTVPEILISGQGNCTVTFDTQNSRVGIDVQINGKTITEESTAYFDTALFQYTENDCGGEIIVSKR